MSRFPCEIEGLNCVLVGEFGPRLLRPHWFGRQELVRPEEVDEAEIVIFIRNLSVFRMGMFKVTVSQDRLSIETNTLEALGPLRDLVIGTVRLLEPPVTMMGINRHMHFRLRDRSRLDALGHRLAPKSAWSPELSKAVTQRLVIQGQRPGSPAQFVNFTVEPSSRVPLGVYVGTNEHYAADAGQDTLDVAHILATEWEDALGFARKTAETMLARGTEEKR